VAEFLPGTDAALAGPVLLCVEYSYVFLLPFLESAYKHQKESLLLNKAGISIPLSDIIIFAAFACSIPCTNSSSLISLILLQRFGKAIGSFLHRPTATSVSAGQNHFAYSVCVIQLGVSILQNMRRVEVFVSEFCLVLSVSMLKTLCN
jgi:hypothetical protein